MMKMRKEWTSDEESGESTEELLESLKGERYMADVFN